MKRALLRLLPVACALAAAAPAQAAGFEKQEVALAMDDGVTLAATLYLPSGAPPAGGWPAVMLFHGLGGTRGAMAPIAENFFANEGYAVLAYDARGHGASGGLVTLDGPREMADLRAGFAWLTARPDVSDTQVGAMGFSYGGGAVLRSAVEGVPWKAIVPAITWTDLYEALAPQGMPKTGAIAGFLQSVQRWEPSVYALAQDALRSQNLDTVRAFAAARSSLPSLAGLTTPAFFIQGRRDYAFDIEQARAGYEAVKGPRRLYLGELGHPPAANPAAEQPHYLTEARQWFDRFLKGLPNGIDTRKPIEVAASPWTGKAVSYGSFPKVKLLNFRLKGRTTIERDGKVVRTFSLPKRTVETFGGGGVTVKLASTTGWPHLVAVLSALKNGKETIVTEGGAPTPRLTRQSKSVTIRFIDTATLIPARSRLRLMLAPASTAQDIANALYLHIGVPQSARLTVGAATLRLPVLRKPVSR